MGTNLSKRRCDKMLNTINDNIKNGEHSINYFSMIYVDAVGKKWTFYPDYILQDVQGNTWIIETKGGETVDGKSKNIDMKVENKFAVLKEYANKYNLKWGFVRAYDKNNSLYICNTEYTEDIEYTHNWLKIDTVL